MARLFNAKFDVKPLKSGIEALKKEQKKGLNNLLKDSANKIASEAKSRAKIPSIAATIRVEKGQNGYTVSAGNGLSDPHIAAYHEFGTGDFARATVSKLPPDWIAYAWTFKKQKD